jgi:hypothetical protein
MDYKNDFFRPYFISTISISNKRVLPAIGWFTSIITSVSVVSIILNVPWAVGSSLHFSSAIPASVKEVSCSLGSV